MSSTHFIGGYVEKIFTHGKMGVIKGLDGNMYYFNQSSFNSGRKRLRVGEAVVFRCGTDTIPGDRYPVVIELKTVNEVMK